MGDKKPKKNSSGSADKHKAKLAKDQAAKPATPPGDANKKGKK
jgi:hypothetical protein